MSQNEFVSYLVMFTLILQEYANIIKPEPWPLCLLPCVVSNRSKYKNVQKRITVLLYSFYGVIALLAAISITIIIAVLTRVPCRIYELNTIFSKTEHGVTNLIIGLFIFTRHTNADIFPAQLYYHYFFSFSFEAYND